MDNKNIKKNILITGATGYLGSYILNSLFDLKDYHLIILKRSFSNTFRIDKVINQVVYYDVDKHDLEKVFEENKIDIILHCATDYGRKVINPMQMIESNLILPVKLLELGRKNNVSVFINTDTILDKRISHYSLSKKQFRDWLSSYKNDLVCINVELEHFYGPGDDKTKFVSYVLDLLLKEVDKIDLTLGEQKRDFVYVEDAVSAFLKILSNLSNLEKGFHSFQICSGQEITIKDLVLKLKNITGNKSTVLNFGALPYRENEIMSITSDSSRIKEFGWKIVYNLDIGLKKMVEEESKNLR